MDCHKAREQIGVYLDGELSDEQQAKLENHLAICQTCASELDKLRALTDRLGEAAAKKKDIKAPPQIWLAIEQRLERVGQHRAKERLIGLFRKPLAAAASLAVLIGVGAFLGIWLSTGTGTAQAVSIDYSMLLDGLAGDVDEAVQRFFKHYNGVPIEADQAHAAAEGLIFAIPPDLPGGYHIQQTYKLRFGSLPGVAACYRRGQEPLVVFFHPPVGRPKMGIHRQSQCHVAGREGHQVEISPWRLIHFTDPTTCHCLLSKIDKESELLAIMDNIAPEFSKTINASH